MDDMMMKLANAQFEAFVDELEKIAAAGGIPEVELEMLKQAVFPDLNGALSGARQALNTGVQRAGQAVGQHLPSVGKTIGALAQPIETGAAGHALQAAGKSFQQHAAPGVLGGMAHGVGEAIAHKGHQLAGGGNQAIGRAAWQMVNPIGNIAEIGATGAGHMASRAMNLDPQGMAHRVLTKHIPLAAEIGGAAGLGHMVHAPVGVAGLIGHKALGGVAAAAPDIAEAAGHAVHGLGEGIGELAHHVGADVAGTHAPGVLGRAGGTARRMGGALSGVLQPANARFMAARAAEGMA